MNQLTVLGTRFWFHATLSRATDAIPGEGPGRFARTFAHTLDLPLAEITGSATTKNTPRAVLRELTNVENAQNAHHTVRGRNRVRIYSEIDGRLVSHFSLCEFENASGLVMIHGSVPRSLELVRRDLRCEAGEEVEIVITDAVRTEDELHQLAQRYGWTHEGGTVSRNSRHLATYGGIAVDIVARMRQTGRRIPQDRVGAVCRRYFDFVKADYPDGHVHADNRYSS